MACFEYSEQTYTVENIINKNHLDLSALIEDKYVRTAVIKKIAIIYNQNKIFIIKPRQLRYWLKSTALLDADTTIADIINLNLH